MNNKKIIFIISSLGGGGAENVCVTLANGLANNGWDVELVVLTLKGSEYLSRLESSVNIVSFDVSRARYSIFHLYSYLKQNKQERVLVFTYHLTTLVVFLNIAFNFKISVISRATSAISKRWTVLANTLRNRIEKIVIYKALPYVDLLICQCNAMEKDFEQEIPLLKGKTRVIYNPVVKHVEDYANSHDLMNIEKEDYFLCVGRLEKQKAFHYAIQAFSEVIKTQPHMRLKIVGQGSLEQELKQLAVDLNIADKVDFEGFQKNMISYYTKAKATVLTSLYEGFPNVLVESITLGTPIVAFDCPSGPSEIVQEGLNGYLVEYLNVDDLVEKLNKACESPIASYKILNTKEKFSVNSVLSKYSNLLGENRC